MQRTSFAIITFMIARKRIVLVVACAFLAVLSAQAAFDVYFLRHGQTDWNREKRLQGSVPHPRLTDEGRRMAGENASAAAKRTLQPNCCVHMVRYENGRFRLLDTGRIYYTKEGERKR